MVNQSVLETGYAMDIVAKLVLTFHLAKTQDVDVTLSVAYMQEVVKPNMMGSQRKKINLLKKVINQSVLGSTRAVNTLLVVDVQAKEGAKQVTVSAMLVNISIMAATQNLN